MRRLAVNDADIDIRDTKRNDEIGEMARSVVVFKNNAIELAVVQRSLAQQASMLEEKLLQERRLAQLQRNFISMVSHEFRTPLTIIDAHAQRLARMNERGPTGGIGQRYGQDPRCRSAHDESDREFAQFYAAHRSATPFPSGQLRHARASARGLPAPSGDRTGIARSGIISPRSLCRWKVIQSYCFKY